MNSVRAIKELRALTSLRFFAAMMIVTLHLGGTFPHITRFNDRLSLNQGVSFFFILSGFILFYSYQHFESIKDVLLFWSKRIARLWPLHMVTMILTIIVLPSTLIMAGPVPTWIVAIANVTLLHAWVPHSQFYLSFNAPSWSISTEFFFYLSLPALILLFRKSRVGLFALVSGLWFCALAVGNAIPEDVSFGNANAAFGLAYISPFSRLFEFTIGFFLASLYLRVNDKLQISRVRASIIESLVLATVVFVIAFTVPISNALAPYIGEAGKHWILTVGTTLVPFSLLILVSAFQRGSISKLLTLRILVFLGEVSFAIYMVHLPLIKLWRLLVPNPETGQSLEIFLLVVFLVVLLALSHILYAVVEIPSKTVITGFARSLIYGDKKTSEKLVFPPITDVLSRNKVILAEISLLVLLFSGYMITDTCKTSISKASMDHVQQVFLEDLMRESILWEKRKAKSAEVASYLCMLKNRIRSSGLVDLHQKEVLDKVSAQYLILSNTHLPIRQWSQAYLEFRGGKKAPYRLSKLTDWEFVDFIHRSHRSNKSLAEESNDYWQ